jgi:hypothetical protein
MNNELERIWKESAVAYKVLAGHLSVRTEKNCQKSY